MSAAAHTLQRIFVYGTLRRGGSNHFRLAGGQFVGEGQVNGRLYRIDWYPGLVLDPGAGEVRGELHEVTAEMLHELDVFEGISAGEIEGCEYRRVPTDVTCGNSTMRAWVWEWVGPVKETDRIPDGDWLGPHADPGK